MRALPDLAGFAAANDLVGKSDSEVREAIGDEFPKHIYHSIVCIGALIAHREPDRWAVDAVGAPQKELIAAFCDKIGVIQTPKQAEALRNPLSLCMSTHSTGRVTTRNDPFDAPIARSRKK